MGLFDFLKPNYNNLSIYELKDVINNSEYHFVDVRTTQEYNAYHIKEFDINIDFHLFVNNHSLADKLDKNKPIIVICQSGIRSRMACGILKDLGFNDVFNVQGGVNDYISTK